MLTIRRYLFFTVLAAMTGTAFADSTPESKIPYKRFYIAVGALWPNIDSEARLDNKNIGIGTEIDFESDLGLKDTDTLFTALITAQISKRWRTEFEWFQLNRDNRAIIDEQIIWGDEVFDIGADIKTKFDLDVFRLGINYSFIQKPRTEAGLGFGAHVTRFATELTAVGSGIITGRVSSEGGDVTAPLPNLGIYLDQLIGNKLVGNLRMDYFKIKLGDYDGSLISTGLNLMYKISDTWGINAGYRYFKLNANFNGDSWKGRIDYAYHGPIAMISASF